MTFLRSVALAFMLFSRIPAPKAQWDERSMRYLMAAFPLVGAAVALGIAAWWLVCDACALGSLGRAAGLTLIPLALTGAIHMDGFCDVVDALSSQAEPQRKRQILKDPHIGAFAAIWAAAYLIAQTAVYTELAPTFASLILLAVMYVVSRAVTGLCVLLLPRSSEEGMGAAFQKAGSKASALILAAVLAAAAVCAVLAGGLPGAALLLAAAACPLCVATTARRQFGGMSGDVAGYLLQVCELAMPLCVVIAQKAVMLL